MMNNYNYYPNSEYNRNQLDYNDFLNYLGLNNNMTNGMNNNMNADMNNNMNTGMNTSMNISINNSNMNNDNLFGSYEGYVKGNMFKGLYMPYKNYEPRRLSPNSEEEETLLNLNQMHFAMHEANLYLDVYPNDPSMFRDYVKFRDGYNKLLKEYQEKYGAMEVNSDYLNRAPFGWEQQTWPWDRRDF